MTTVARKIAAAPSRTASKAWKVIVDLLSREGTAARSELMAVEGIACSLIADEHFCDAPATVSGSGPQVRIYCLYGDKAIDGDTINEKALSFDATSGDWRMSLPCSAEDLDWVTTSLKKKSTRVTARDMDGASNDESDDRSERKLAEFDIEGFLNA